jgi:4-amino-4-deoxy-L-arabinose transferase-like glycosyltransferase
MPSWLRRYWQVALILVLAGALRGVWLTADPPVSDPVGIVWHDEGAWTHNARNQALWGVWRTDAWNPVFIAPVFTALEAVAFSTFGVGTWQARIVPAVSGLAAILALMIGLRATSGRHAALCGGLLLATNYTWVMWNRAALMESTMTAFMVIAWSAYAVADHRHRWGLMAGGAAVAAFFTKAAAAFFVAALLLEIAGAWWQSRRSPLSWSAPTATLLGLAGSGLLVAGLFVLPYWTEFQFYNWEMTVERKPTYSLDALIQRASWLPVVHGVFSRSWLVVVLGSLAALRCVARWRDAPPAIRLLVLWVVVGLLELVVHDSGNERRYVMFIPAFVGLFAHTIADRTSPGALRGLATRVATAGLAMILGYLIAGSLIRLFMLDAVMAGDYRWTVRSAAALAVAAGVWTWRYGPPWRNVPAGAVTAALILTVGIDFQLFGRFAAGRTTHNVNASRMLSGLLPPDTLVHGKLANGLALENRIRPVFVGRGFGNYADRFGRDDVRYILSYTQANGEDAPGYEGDVILDVLRHYPDRRFVVEFDVQETPGSDRAALIAKFPDGPDPRARNQ